MEIINQILAITYCLNTSMAQVSAGNGSHVIDIDVVDDRTQRTDLPLFLISLPLRPITAT
jgi:hypothetical protein